MTRGFAQNPPADGGNRCPPLPMGTGVVGTNSRVVMFTDQSGYHESSVAQMGGVWVSVCSMFGDEKTVFANMGVQV